MRFIDLHPQFVQLTRTSDPCARWPFHPVGTLAEADGVMFLCPVHFEKNGGASGTHSVICWFKNRDIPDELTPGPGRWEADCGEGGLATLTLTPSVDLGNGDWHGFIKNGEVT